MTPTERSANGVFTVAPVLVGTVTEPIGIEAIILSDEYADPETLVPYSQKKQLDTFRSYNRLAG